MPLPRQAPSSPRLHRIGEVANRSGVGIEALRFYERRGLIEPATRTDAGYRLYDQGVFERLSFIRKAQTIGFNLDEIARIVSDAHQGRQPCAEVRKLATDKLAELDQRITELKRYRRELQATVQAWEKIGGKKGVICGLIEGLQPAESGGATARRTRPTQPVRREERRP